MTVNPFAFITAPGAPSGTRVEQAERIRAEFRRMSEQLAANRDTFTDKARHDQLVDLRAQANAAIQELADAEKAAGDAEQADLERYVFGPPPLPLGASPSDRIVRDASYRDARDRARGTDRYPMSPDQGLVAMYRDARTIGDELQQKACLAVAMERGDADVCNAFSADHPGDEDRVDRLWALRARDGNMNDLLQFGLAFAGVQ